MSVVFTDISEFQIPLNDSYPYRWVAFRHSDGTYVDPNFNANYAWARAAVASNKITGFIVYHVFRPGVTAQVATLNGILKNNPSTAIMLDIENWGGQISGDHSAEIASLRAQIGVGVNVRRIGGYANSSDYQNLFPTVPAGMWMIGAGYGSVNNSIVPNQIAQQYTDGQYNVAGLPSSTPPFGPCDHNVAPAYATAEDLCTAMGATPGDDMSAADVAAINAQVVKSTHDNAQYLIDHFLTPLVANQNKPLCVKFVNSGAGNNESAVYMVVGNYLLYLNGSVYGWLGNPPVLGMDSRAPFWNFPVYPGTPDYRGKTTPDPFVTDADLAATQTAVATNVQAVHDQIAALPLPAAAADVAGALKQPLSDAIAQSVADLPGADAATLAQAVASNLSQRLSNPPATS